MRDPQKPACHSLAWEKCHNHRISKDGWFCNFLEIKMNIFLSQQNSAWYTGTFDRLPCTHAKYKEFWAGIYVMFQSFSFKGKYPEVLVQKGVSWNTWRMVFTPLGVTHSEEVGSCLQAMCCWACQDPLPGGSSSGRRDWRSLPHSLGVILAPSTPAFLLGGQQLL